VLDVREQASTKCPHQPRQVGPLSTLDSVSELDPNQSYYIHCTRRALAKGRAIPTPARLQTAQSVKGGIDAWSDEIDRTVPSTEPNQHYSLFSCARLASLPANGPEIASHGLILYLAHHSLTFHEFGHAGWLEIGDDTALSQGRVSSTACSHGP